MLAPVALFVYNRLWHTRQTVEALLQNVHARESDLIVFSDGAKSAKDESAVSEVREYIRSIKGFNSVEIVASDTNKGLARSITSGVTYVLGKRENIIVLEDDLVTSPHFLEYMNQALALYQNDDEVISIHGYMYPVKQSLPESFFLRGADCWGWATWNRGWSLFDYDGKRLLEELESRDLVRDFNYNNSYPYKKMLVDQINSRNDSWAIRWYASAFLKNKLTLYPGVSLVNNIGHDNSGTHSGSSKHYDVSLRSDAMQLAKVPLVENANARAAVARYFKGLRRLSVGRIFKLGLRLIGK